MKAWAIFTVMSMVSTVTSTITVISQLTKESVAKFEDVTASFVPDRVTHYELQGYLIDADPPNACESVQLPPETSRPMSMILIAERFGCDFETKIENAQNMGYSGIIIQNLMSNETVLMRVRDPDRVVIYAALIGEHNGNLLRNKYSAHASNFTYFLFLKEHFQSDYALTEPASVPMHILMILLPIFFVGVMCLLLCIVRARKRVRQRGRKGRLNEIPLKNTCKAESVNSAK